MIVKGVDFANMSQTVFHTLPRSPHSAMELIQTVQLSWFSGHPSWAWELNRDHS